MNPRQAQLHTLTLAIEHSLLLGEVRSGKPTRDSVLLLQVHKTLDLCLLLSLIDMCSAPVQHVLYP
jgi:hypothetical protein